MEKQSSIFLSPVQFQIIESVDSVILKRGSTTFKIDGKRSAEVVQTLLDYLHHTSATKVELLQLFAKPDQPAIEFLIDELSKRRFLTETQNKDKTKDKETGLDVFYWHFGENTKFTKSVLDKKITIIGVNSISRHLAYSLNRSGMKKINIVDYPPFRDINNLNSKEWPMLDNPPIDVKEWEDNFKPNDVDCLVATSEFGAFHFMRKWNKFCVTNNCKFLPVLFDNLIGYVGPLVIPQETACFECFLNRRKSSIGEFEIHPDENSELNEIQFCHPIIASILGDIAAMELIKFYIGWKAIFNVGKVIEVNMLATKIETHNVLKIPRCSVCSRLNKIATTSFKKPPPRELE